MYLYRPQQFFFLGSSIRSVHFPYRCLDVENSFHRNEQLNVRKDRLKKKDELFLSHKKGFFKKKNKIILQYNVAGAKLNACDINRQRQR